MKRFFLILTALLAMTLVFVACGSSDDNGEENGYEENGEAVQNGDENGNDNENDNDNEPEEPEEPPIDPTTVFTAAEGSTSLRVETMGNVQWDGAQIPTAALGLEPGNVYQFSLEVFTAITPDGAPVGLVLQTSGPLWRHIAHSPLFSYGDELTWHLMEGELDLSAEASLPDNLQLVKNPSVGTPTANATFFLDNFIVYHDGERIAMFNFEDGNTAGWGDSGQALVTTAVADPLAVRPPNPEWDMGLPSLAARWEDYFIFGNIIEPAIIRDNPRGVVEMFLHHYRAVTAENAMKVDAVSGGGNQTTRPANLNLTGARAIVEFAEANNLYMVGHTLVWHSQSAPWLYRNPNTGDFLTREQAKENMRWFIEQYAGYFGDRIDAWDVTNEVFTSGGGPHNISHRPAGSPYYALGTWQRALRNYVPWYHAFANEADFDAGERGYDYIYYAFVFARRYAPTALLIYNDYNDEIPAKRNAIANMVEELNERWHADSVNNPAFGNPAHADYGRLLIEVIGMQAHYNHNTNMAHIRDSIERFSQTGTRIHVTELDIHFQRVVPEPFVMTDAQQIQQAEMFAQLFEWYREFSDYIDRVTIWGREDATSWRGDGAATHFDRFYRPKPAFWAIYDPDGWQDRLD